MFKFSPITTETHPCFLSVWTLYQTAFPKHEQRTLKGQINCFKQIEFHLLAIMTQKAHFVGFLSYWQVGQMLYLEHLAIDPQERNNGIGSKILTAFLEQHPALCALEIDPLVTSIANRRHDFYLRLDFCDNVHLHHQPPYQIGDTPAPMLLMSHPRPLTQQEHEALLAFLFSEKTCRI